MALEFGFYDSYNGDRKYNARQMNGIFEGIINDGVYASVGEKFTVKPGTGLQVIVGTGRAWFKETWNYNPSALPIDLDQPDPVYSRIDIIALEVNKNDSYRNNQFIVIKGSVMVSPTPPIIPSADKVFHLPLAYVTIRANAKNITNSDIQILVGTSTCPYVTSILQQTNIDQLFANWNQQFTDWWNDIKSILNENVVGELINRIDACLKTEDFNAMLATTAEAQAGTSDAKWMTPLKVKQAIDKQTGPDNHEVGYILYDPSLSFPPTGYLRCDGRYIDASAYPEYTQKVGLRYAEPFTDGYGRSSMTLRTTDVIYNYSPYNAYASLGSMPFASDFSCFGMGSVGIGVANINSSSSSVYRFYGLSISNNGYFSLQLAYSQYVQQNNSYNYVWSPALTEMAEKIIYMISNRQRLLLSQVIFNSSTYLVGAGKGNFSSTSAIICHINQALRSIDVGATDNYKTTYQRDYAGKTPYFVNGYFVSQHPSSNEQRLYVIYGFTSGELYYGESYNGYFSTDRQIGTYRSNTRPIMIFNTVFYRNASNVFSSYRIVTDYDNDIPTFTIPESVYNTISNYRFRIPSNNSYRIVYAIEDTAYPTKIFKFYVSGGQVKTEEYSVVYDMDYATAATSIGYGLSGALFTTNGSFDRIVLVICGIATFSGQGLREHVGLAAMGISDGTNVIHVRRTNDRKRLFERSYISVDNFSKITALGLGSLPSDNAMFGTLNTSTNYLGALVSATGLGNNTAKSVNSLYIQNLIPANTAVTSTSPPFQVPLPDISDKDTYRDQNSPYFIKVK